LPIEYDRVRVFLGRWPESRTLFHHMALALSSAEFAGNRDDPSERRSDRLRQAVSRAVDSQ